MPIPPAVVAAARCTWHWQWQQLMAGLGPADADGNYRRPPRNLTNFVPDFAVSLMGDKEG
jgi:putative glutathione S-transferase